MLRRRFDGSSQLGAVFGHGTAGQRNAAFAENLDDFLVRERLVALSREIKSWMASLTLVFDITSPEAVW